MDEITPCKLQQ